MFNEPGRKIKTMARVLFWLSMIGSLSLGIAFGRDRYGDVEFLTFLLIFVSGAVVSFVSSLVLYGIGDAVENISDMASEVCRANMMLDRISELAAGQGKAGAQSIPEKPIRNPTGSFNLADYIN